MSARRSLTTAVRDQLRDTVLNGGLAIPASDCDVMGDGRPAPNCGKWFYAVHQGSRSNQWLLGDESTFGVNVTISGRANEPFDRIGTNLVDLLNGLDDKADAVWTCIFAHQWTGQIPGTVGVMTRANTILSAPESSYGWTEALYPTSMTEPQPVTPDWFSASEAQQHKKQAAWGEKMPFVGLRITINFMGAKRLMNNADATG